MDKAEKYGTCFLVAVAFCFSIVGSAQASCGEVVIPAGFYSPEDPEERQAIEDCANPFGETTHSDSSVVSRFAGTSITTGDELVVEGLPAEFSYDNELAGIPLTAQVEMALYHQVGADYYLVPFAPPEVTFHATGTYVLVTNAYELLLTENTTWWRTLTDLFTPAIAYAETPYFSEVYVTTFTVALTPPPAPTGASSVLFLPGIQASRLYTDGALGTENQLWEPNRDADVEKLAMTGEGESINAIYTKDVLDEINVLPVPQENIYKGFLAMLDDMVESGEIASSTAFAYDWRYDVFDVVTSDIMYPDNQVKRLLDEVLQLAESSYTGKVTIVGHSNGGLVAKALLSTYGEAELTGKVDKIVLIGTPQLGTPKAIGSMLHGLDQSLGLGLVATADTVRQVTKNMPGAYTLLPSLEYFNQTNEPVITTDGSVLAQSVAEYGEIDTAEALHNFLLNSLSNRGEAVGLNEPITLNTEMSTHARTSQTTLNAWRAPAGVSVYEVAGTGLATIKGYEYREYGCVESNAFCVLDTYLIFFPIMTNEGDETVVEHSAVGYGGDKTVAKVDLSELNNQFSHLDRAHKSLTETEPVQDFVKSVIKYPYLIEAVVEPEFTSVSSEYTIIAVHSPVSLQALDNTGKRVGIVDGEIKEEISSSQYFELGESKYIVLPREANVSVMIQGTGEGIYSLTIDELLADGTQENRQTIGGLPVTPTMRAQFTQRLGVLGPIVTDSDGDLAPDIEYNWDGSITILAEEVSDKSPVVVDQKVTGTRVRQVSGVTLPSAPMGNMVGASSDQPRELNEYEKKLYILLIQLQDILIKMYGSNKK
jgi:hypothetical protein